LEHGARGLEEIERTKGAEARVGLIKMVKKKTSVASRDSELLVETVMASERTELRKGPVSHHTGGSKDEPIDRW